MEPALTPGAIGGPPTIILPLLLRIVWVVGARVGGGGERGVGGEVG